MKTFGDQFVQVQDVFTSDVDQGRIARLSRRAVRQAYADISSRHQWQYLLKRSQINTVTPYSLGSVQFTEATGVMTLTGGVWPSWAASGNLLINRNVYAIYARLSDTQVQMQPLRQPSEDLPAGTGFILVQTDYQLPSDFVELRQIVEIERWWPLSYLAPEEMLKRTQIWFAPTSILFYSILGGENGLLNLVFSPPPDIARTYDLIYDARPRLPVLTRPYVIGICSFTSGSQIVTFTGGTLPQNVSGCVFRIGTDDIAPEGETDDNPYVEEHIIQSVQSTTQITLATPMQSTGTGILYSIDDPIDIEPVSMGVYFDRMCESRIFRMLQVDPTSLQLADAAEAFAYKKAIQADGRLTPRAMQSNGVWGSLADGFWGATPHGAP